MFLNSLLNFSVPHFPYLKNGDNVYLPPTGVKRVQPDLVSKSLRKGPGNISHTHTHVLPSGKTALDWDSGDMALSLGDIGRPPYFSEHF